MLGVFLFLLFVPVVKLLRRTGHSAAWSLLSIVPGAAWTTRQRFPFGVCDLGKLLRPFGPLPLAHEVDFQRKGARRETGRSLLPF
jgi:hypothetical protein